MDNSSADHGFGAIILITGKLIWILAAAVSVYASWASEWNIYILGIALPTITISGVLITIEIEKIVKNIGEIVGKFVFVLTAIVAVIALVENNWNIETFIVATPTLLLSGMLIFIDFKEIRFRIYKKTGFEWIKPNESELVELTEGYDQLVEIVSKESKMLAINLRHVQKNTGSEDPFSSLSSVIEKGINTNPVEQTVDRLKHLLNIKEYIEDTNKSKLEIITLTDNKVLAECTDGDTDPVEGLESKLFAEIEITERGETRSFEKVVAMAELTKNSGEVYELSTYNWESGGDATISELKANFTERNPYLEVNEDDLEGVEWDKLNDSYEFLRSMNNSETTDGN
jgi:hypothetical protein